MRNTKRILSLFLAVCMLVSCMATVVFAEEAATESGTKFSDVKADSSYAVAVTTLNQMGVINGYEDGTFGPDRNVTRAEFTAMLMRTLGYGDLGNTSAAKLPFVDLDDSDASINWSFPSINIAYDMGIINGYEDSTFRPRNNVAFEEAVKMIICAIGYQGIDASATPWYANYVAQANRIGITTNASQLGAPETPAIRACIAQMLYDSLEANICENGNVTGKTILSSYLGYIKNTGKISSDGTTSLTAPDVTLNSDEIQIYAQEPNTVNYESHTYKAKDLSLRNYLGYELEFYYKTDGVTRDLSFYTLRPCNELTLDASAIEPATSTDTQLRYYKSETAGSASYVNLDTNNVVIYNGKLYGTNNGTSRFSTSMIPKVGTVTLIDSDRNNSYDLVKIQAYEIYYVASKVSNEYSIIDDVTRSTDKTLILDVQNGSVDTKIVDVNGNDMNYSSISVGNVICLAKTNSGNGGDEMQTAVVVKESVTGKVTASKDGESITVNGKTYKFSAAAPWMPGGTGTLAEPVMHDAGTFYLDINGKVAAYKKDVSSDVIPYGYIMGIGASTGAFDDALPIKVLSQDGQKQELMINSSTKINGNGFGDVNQVVNALKASGDGTNPQQLIKYSTRVNNGMLVIDRIYIATAVTTGQNLESDKLYYYSAITDNEDATYTASGTRFSQNGKTLSVSNAIVFAIPSDRSSHEDYYKTTVSSAFRDGKPYKIMAYDVGSTNIAKVVVSLGASAASEVDELTAFSLMNEEPEYSLNNGETMGFMKGFKSSYNKPKDTLSDWLSPTTGYTPVLGDIFRSGTDTDGYATIEDSNVIYKVAGGNKYGQFVWNSTNKQFVPDTSGFTTNDCAVMLGSVVAADEDNITILPQYLTQTDNPVDTAGAIPYAISNFSYARVVKYNYDTNGKLTSVDDAGSDYQGVLKGMTTYNNGASTPTKVMIYMYRGSIRMIAVLGENIDSNPR